MASNSTTPAEALELYLTERTAEGLSDSTIYSHENRLSKFIDWCDETGVESMSEIDGLSIHQFRAWRSEGIKKVTLKTQLDTLRVFIRFCERVEIVEEDLAEKIPSIELSKAENSSDTMLDADRASHILDHLEQWKYCSRPHVQFVLLWRLGCRLGALRSLDVRDIHLNEQYVSFRHRPETGTPLKNGLDGERDAAISPETAGLLADWIDERRPDVTDEHGRTPLVATDNGRVSRQSVRRVCYAYTRPCKVGKDCPHGRSEDDCKAANYSYGCECPDSVSPHPLRRGSITHWLSSGVDDTMVSGRMDVSPDVIEDHYDQRSEREKMEARRQFLENVRD